LGLSFEKDFGSTLTSTTKQERPAMTDVLISAGELADLASREPCVIIDTRNPDAYSAGHIPNAVNVHEIFTYLATSTPEGIHELKTKFADAFGKAGLSGKKRRYLRAVDELRLRPVLPRLLSPDHARLSQDQST
jgi:rhodanese-related sulfurtransferase